MNDWFEDRWAYLSLVLALALPIEAHTLPPEAESPAHLDNRDAADLQLLLEEGQRQSDTQERLLTSVRSRAQWLFTTGLALLAVLASKAGPPEFRPPTWSDVYVTLGLAATAYGILGASALLVVRARFGEPDIGYLANADPATNVLATLVSDHLSGLRISTSTVRTRLTVLFEVAVWILLGAAAAVALYISR